MQAGTMIIVCGLLALACAQRQPCADGQCKAPVAPGGDETSLLQTSHQVKIRSKSIKKQLQTSSLDSAATHQLQTATSADKAASGSKTLSNHTAVAPVGAATHAKKSIPKVNKGECLVFMPIDLRIMHHSLRMVGLAPPDETCDPGDPMFGMMDFMLTQVSSTTHRLGFFTVELEDSYYLALPVGYGVIMAFLLFRMLVNILYTRSPKHQKKQTQNFGLRRPELESWQRGYLNWLFVDWVDGWIAKWGNVEDSDATKITAEELDNLGDPDDEVQNSYDKLKVFWDEEVDNVGLQQASIPMVLCRFVGWNRILMVTVWSMFYETCMFLGPPLAMAWVVRYVEWLYMARLKGEVITWKALTPATVMAITLFQGLPAFMAISNSIGNMMGMRISIRVCGGLSSLAFAKAQRLPLCSLEDDQDQQKWDVRKEAEAKEQQKQHHAGQASPDQVSSGQPTLYQQQVGEATDQTESSTESDAQFCQRWGHHFPENCPECVRCGAQRPKTEAELEEEIVFDEEGNGKIPTKFNLVQVVANDINTQVVDAPLALCRLAVLLPIVVILFSMLWEKIRLALVVCIGASCIMSFLIFWAAGSQMGWLAAFMFYSGKRLMFVEDMLFNIRTVKAFGWEGIMEERVYQLRVMELVVLWGYYLRLGTFYGMLYQFPKVMTLIGLWGYTWIYGVEKPVNIFTTLPILFTFQSAVMSLMMIMPAVINAIPALGRLSAFMKLPEAPVPRYVGAESDQYPEWVNVWPDVKGPFFSEESSQKMQIQGSFLWKGQDGPTLKDLNLTIPAGTSVAVLGKVGSGKSSLLNAMIGELYPVGDSRLSIPAQIAYSGQSPYICEGTLKENILFGEPYNEKHYHACVFSASLFPDIQALPGGDEVPIGSRGISLSGGQRARVSMARAAYCTSAQAVVIDDPFAAVDSRTARHLLDEYVHGAVLKGRTKVIACQPDPERIQDFDKVIILHGGRIVAEGTPKQVMQTSSYKNLLNEHQKVTLDTESGDVKRLAVAVTNVHERKSNRSNAFHLREDECENRPDWKTIKHFLNLGGWGYLISCICLFLVMMIMQLLMQIVLQNWASDALLVQAGMMYPIPHPHTYLWPYMGWWAGSIAVWIVCWAAGMQFTHNLSKKVNTSTVRTILHAPVDRFFDRTPVGRIMNRMSTDLLNIDINTFNNITQMISVVWMSGVPLVYLHVLMPVYFTCACIPFYYLMFLLVRRFWNTLVPMRYLLHISKSHTDSTLTEVQNSNAFVRACGKGDFKFKEFQKAMMDQIKADITSQMFLKRWVVNRLFLMMGFFVCSMVLICIWIPNTIAVGGIGLCLANMFTLIASIETDIESTMKAQFQFISLKRLHDYTCLDQEADFEKATDTPYANYSVKIKRAKLGKLEVEYHTEKGRSIVRKRTDYDQRVLQQAEHNTFMAPDGFALVDPSDADLQQCQDWHRLAAVNGKGTQNIDAMVDELCNGFTDEVVLEIQSGWLLPGAHLVISELVAGYGDIARNVLKQVTIDVLPRTKLGVVGTTGCGKSTLLLCILRILEPKGGKILLNDIDTSTLGLKTLRTTIGMVAQDPVLMQCSIRDNLDPFAQFDDDVLWKGLEMVQMKDTIAGLPNGLGFEISGDGNNLSFGQRQLLCMARMVIRQPALILLDEATSALDPATQQQVQHTVEQQFPESTMIMIAHRLETIANFDKVVVMDQGRVVEQGPPAELKEVKDGIFAKMWAAKQTW